MSLRHPDLDPNNLGPSRQRHRAVVNPQQKAQPCSAGITRLVVQ